MLLADFIAENWFLQILLFDFTILASGGYMRAFQMSNFKNRNCSELLLTNGMELDGAPVKFLTLVFLRPPSAHSIETSLHTLQCTFFSAQNFTAHSSLHKTSLHTLQRTVQAGSWLEYALHTCLHQSIGQMIAPLHKSAQAEISFELIESTQKNTLTWSALFK